MGLLLRVALGVAVWFAVGVLLCLPFYPGVPADAIKRSIWMFATVVAVTTIWKVDVQALMKKLREGRRGGYPPEWPTS
ncbi:hypothetical protein ACPPTR_08980 [Ralstonia pseudosolanacearum]|uniref:hypothetical protein n=1 Tax=Ralstonia pseudosolanacearum TaxID=1310165 RepID=UPI0018CFF54C|nr:hypothetical protein [Ralstonia pseudosolanacearum]